MTELKVACLGAGYFAQFHHQSWRRLDDVRLVAVCDLDEVKAKASGTAAHVDLDRMLRDHAPDILDIILPPDAHASAIRTAIAHGVKTIVCQKPFCASLEMATNITHEAAAAGTNVIVHENFRFQPWYRTIRTAIQAGRIGTVHQATFRLRPGDGQGADAYLDRQPYFQKMKRFLIHETAVHWIDVFRFLLGSPHSVYADLRQLNPAISGEDAGYVIFDMGNGTRALFDGNRHLDHAADNLRRTMGEGLIEGTKGALTLLGDGSVWLRDAGKADAICLLPPDRFDGFGGDCVHHLQHHVVNGVLGRGEFENTASSYLEVIRIEEAIYQSAQNGCKVVM